MCSWLYSFLCLLGAVGFSTAFFNIGDHGRGYESFGVVHGVG